MLSTSEIKRRSSIKKTLEDELALLEQKMPTEQDIEGLRAILTVLADDLHALMYSDIPKARKALTELLDEPIVVTLVFTNGKKSLA